MHSLLWFIFAAIVIVVVQSDQLDPGPQTFNEKALTAQKSQKRYATKDVIVYLTPSQIKAIQEGKGYISAKPVDGERIFEENQNKQQQQREPNELYELNHLQIKSEEEEHSSPSLPVEEPNFQHIYEDPLFSWIYNPEEKQFIPSPEDAFAYSRYYPETKTQTERTLFELGENKETQSDTPNPQGQRFRHVPYDASTEKYVHSLTKVPQKDSFREHWLRLLEMNRLQLRKQQFIIDKTAPTTKTAAKELKSEPDNNKFSKIRFSSKYNDQKQAIENEERRKILKEKLIAIIKTPAVINKEVTTIKQQQEPLIKYIDIPTPILVPIPEPFEVKVPQPFPVPLEILKPISSPATKLSIV